MALERQRAGGILEDNTHSETQEETRLADAGIADQYQLEEVVVVPLAAGGFGRGGRCWCHGSVVCGVPVG